MPLLWLSCAFLLGIPLAALLPLPAPAWLAGAALAGFVFTRLFPAVRARLRQAQTAPGPVLPRLSRTQSILRFPHFASRLHPPVPCAFLLLFLFLGAWRYQSVQPRFTPGFIAWYNGREGESERQVVVEGVLDRPADERDRSALLTVQVAGIRPEEEAPLIPVRGRLLARVQPGRTWRYGDRVILEGVLQEPPDEEEFSYRDYLARQGIHSLMEQARASLVQPGQGSPIRAAIYSLQERALATIYRLYPDPEASLLAGILLGIDTRIPESVERAFQTTGTAHIIAISGFNFTLIAGLFSTLFLRLLGGKRRFLAAGLSVLCIALYAILVGGSASVVRAALMGGLSLFARQLGRRQDGLNSLAFVAAVMALFNPLSLWDPGFQLSFTATLGLVLYAEPLSQAFLRFATRHLPIETARRLAGPVGEYFLFTLAAQLLSLPVTLYHFRRFSLVAWAANPVILPAQPAVMVLGGLAVLVGLVFLPAGRIMAYLSWPFIAFTIRAVELLARLPGGSFELGALSLPAIAAIYALILGWTWAAPRFRQAAAAIGPSAALLGLGSLAVLVWQAALAAPDLRLHVTVLDVGGGGRSGDALLIQTPTGRSLLVDGGPSARQLSDGLGRRLPLAQRELDLLVVAASGTEQVGALPSVLGRFPPARILWAGPPQGTYESRLLLEAVNEAALAITPAETGQAFDLGEGAWLRVIWAGERGAVLLLEWHNFRLLLPVGVDFEAFEALENGRVIGRVTALLLADGGYAPSNPPEWIAALNPQLILLSVDALDRRGLPDPETLEAVQGYPLLRTDRNGWIHLTTDGERMWVEAAR